MVTKLVILQIELDNLIDPIKPINGLTRPISDPRSLASPKITAGGPNQSRSFKILQHVTNTFGAESDTESDQEQQRMDNEPMREQLPLFSRPMEMDDSQMRRLQLSEQDRAFMNRVKNQGDYLMRFNF
jgi:hypothetical protein